MLNYLFSYSPLVFLVQSFWRDEAFTYLLSKHSIVEILILTAKDFNPPFYYLLVHGWMSLFGSSELSLRMISFISFLGLIWVCHYLWVHTLSQKSRNFVWVAILIVINPFLLYYAFEARMYSLLTLLSALSYYAFFQRKKKLHIIITVLLLYTHYFGILILGTQYMLTLVNKRQRLFPHIKQTTQHFAIIALNFMPWVLFCFMQKRDIMQSFWIHPTVPIDILKFPAILYTGYEFSPGFPSSYFNDFAFPTFMFVISSLFLGVGLISTYIQVIKNKHSQHYETVRSLLLWSLGPSFIIFIVSFYKPLFLPRYIIFSTPPLILILCIFVFSLKKIFRIAFYCFLCVFALSYLGIQIQYRLKQDVAIVFRKINLLAHTEDLVYVTNELNFHVAQYYFDPQKIYIYGKRYEEIPSYVGKILIPKERLTSTLPRFPRKAFILHDDLNLEIQSTY